MTDFGLASTQTDATMTMSGDVLGTLRYMSPEQAAGEHGSGCDVVNTVRLHGVLGYVTPQDKLLGREQAIFDDRDRSTRSTPSAAS